jgi:hypothetical protein
LSCAGPRRFAADLQGSGISNASTDGSRLGAIARSRGEKSWWPWGLSETSIQLEEKRTITAR